MVRLGASSAAGGASQATQSGIGSFLASRSPRSPSGRSRSSRGLDGIEERAGAEDEDEDDEDDDEDDDEEEDFQGQKKMLLFANNMNNMRANRAPKVPPTPAPPYHPVRKAEHPPVALVMPPPPTAIGRVMNSSIGRCVTFSLTLLSFGASSAGLVLWQEPERQLHSEAVPMLSVTVLVVAAMFTVVPALAKKAGMAPTEKGVDWKPYFVLYRLSFCCAIPALFCLAFGYGAMGGFGTQQGQTGQITLAELDRQSLNYFEASDGFVALNLTKGVIETLRLTNHGGNTPRSSRFRDAELRINTEPFSDQVEPTMPPGAVKVMRVAPVFSRWTICVSRYSMSVACLQQNPVIGWAYSVSSSLCTELFMVACKNPQPILDPVYHCSTNPVYGSQHRGPISGLCGRVAKPPREGALDELSAILLEEGWPQAALPNVTQVWLDVTPDDCIAHPEACISRWNLVGTAGLAFGLLTVCFIFVPCVVDCWVDRRIREARKFFAEVHKVHPKVVM